ncbi:sodium:proton antiporter [Kocuria sp.]|uniref:sodium:proton antiporter n=1 Tax=Kocuria sp. TaxID=1871328 RepID=UPI0026DFD9E4|nr:cation:proton antiporter subunit C [Kocuria sp.]MDO5618996.1 cation:proton antiporter subunit C [Kocuria sp.]
MTIAITIGILVAGATYLFLQREMLRIILGFILLGHAGNLILIAAGGTSRREEPFGTPVDTSAVADPLPQAFVLTAIVIAFSITIFMLVLAVTGKDDDDTTEPPGDDDDPEFNVSTLPKGIIQPEDITTQTINMGLADNPGLADNLGLADHGGRAPLGSSENGAENQGGAR